MRGMLAVAGLVILGSAACGGEAPPAPHVATTRPVAISSARAPASWEGPGHSTGPSYDEALATPEDMSAVAGEHELTDVELAQPLRSPAFLDDCNVPDAMKVMVKVAVRDGAAIGVTVRTMPDDVTVAECIDKAVRGLAWTPSKKRDSLTTTY